MPQPSESWPRISSALFYDDAANAIDWLCRAFGFEVRLKIPGDGNRIEHSELTYGDGLIMVGSSGGKVKPWCASPRSLHAANTQSICVRVDDVDAHCARARQAGATVVTELSTNDYGDEHPVHRTYEALDPEGHHWWFMQVMRGPKRKS